MFAKISVPRVHEEIVRQISHHVLTGALPPGQRLPSERDLAEQFGVSRATVREALRVLEVGGVIEARPGSGLYICPEAPLKAAAMDIVIRDQPTAAEVIEARSVLEPAVARLAALRRSDEDIAAIGQALADMEEEVTREGRFLPASDFRFHMAIAAAAGNRVLASALDQAYRNSAQRIWLLARESILADPAKAKASLERHRAIYEAICAGDGEAAEQISWEHALQWAQELTRSDDLEE